MTKRSSSSASSRGSGGSSSGRGPTSRAPGTPPEHHSRSPAHPRRPRRLLVVAPSWVGDAVMATPTFRVLRELMPSAFIAAAVRPGVDQMLEGSDFFDEVHVASGKGLSRPVKLAAGVRPRKYDTALLLTGSFSTALACRLAAIPRRIGYERDGRRALLTERLHPKLRKDVEPYSASSTKPSAYAPVPACDYYFDLATHLLGTFGVQAGAMGPLELAATPSQELAAAQLLQSAGVPMEEQHRTTFVLLNPGGNNEAKRWPADRFAAVGDYLAKHHKARILINGSPAEMKLVKEVASLCKAELHTQGAPICLPQHNNTLGKLKGIVKRCKLVVTNDTGPRHIAAAFGVPVVSLFGPTDPRWTVIPFEDERVLVADPALPKKEVADDHPERCKVDRIGVGDVVSACNDLLTQATASP